MGRPQTISDAQIGRAARKVFLKLGPNSSTDAVAQELGVSAAAIFKRVGSKERLLQMAFGPTRPPAFLERIATGPDGTAPMREQLLTLAEQMTTFVRDVVPSLLAMEAAGITPGGMARSPSRSPRALTLDAVAAWLRRAQDLGRIGPGSPPALAALYVGAIEAGCFIEHFERRRRTRALLRSELVSMIDTLWLGIAPNGGDRG